MHCVSKWYILNGRKGWTSVRVGGLSIAVLYPTTRSWCPTTNRGYRIERTNESKKQTSGGKRKHGIIFFCRYVMYIRVRVRDVQYSYIIRETNKSRWIERNCLHVQQHCSYDLVKEIVTTRIFASLWLNSVVAWSLQRSTLAVLNAIRSPAPRGWRFAYCSSTTKSHFARGFGSEEAFTFTFAL